VSEYRRCSHCGSTVSAEERYEHERLSGGTTACREALTKRVAEGLSIGRFFIVGPGGRDSTTEAFGPYTAEQIHDEMLKVGAQDGFVGWAGPSDLIGGPYGFPRPRQRGQWAVVEVKVHVPKPIDIVKAWKLPEEERY
jgi:hypothetical protein